MIYWAITLFALGLLALADYSITRGAIFGPINSVFFLIISLAVLIRVRNKEKLAHWEKLQAENEELRNQILPPDNSSRQKEKVKETVA